MGIIVLVTHCRTTDEMSTSPSIDQQQLVPGQSETADEMNRKDTKTFEPPRIVGKIHIANAGDVYNIFAEVIEAAQKSKAYFLIVLEVNLVYSCHYLLA